MAKIGIPQIKYLSDRDFDESLFQHRDARIMDRFSKLAMLVGEQLYHEVAGKLLAPERLAVVLATSTGARQSVFEFHQIMEERGYVGVNPSKFPNTMLSTPLSRITTALQAKGPSVPLYIEKNRLDQAVLYGLVQLKNSRCDAVIVLIVNEGSGCFALWLEHENSANVRGCKIRFHLNDDYPYKLLPYGGYDRKSNAYQ